MPAMILTTFASSTGRNFFGQRQAEIAEEYASIFFRDVLCLTP